MQADEESVGEGVETSHLGGAGEECSDYTRCEAAFVVTSKPVVSLRMAQAFARVGPLGSPSAIKQAPYRSRSFSADHLMPPFLVAEESMVAAVGKMREVWQVGGW